jgi:hypothetical protein
LQNTFFTWGVNKMILLNILFTRTAILLYISLLTNIAMYNGVFVAKDKLTLTVCSVVNKAVAQYNADNEDVDALDARLGKK